jgi:RNA polymerase sigma-70 factor, ECF subfamily
MSATETGTLQVPGASLYYEVRGAGPLLRLIAGAPGGFARFARLAHPALVNGTDGVVLVAEGRPFAVLGFTIRHGKIAEIDIFGDPARLRRLDLPVPDP